MVSGPSKRFTIVASVAISIIAFGLWQIYDLVMYYVSPPILVIYILFLAIPSIIIAIFFLFTKLTKSTLEKQGFRKPTTIKALKCVLLSVGFIVIYVLIYMFPAITTGNYSYQALSANPLIVMHRVASAILFGLATESVFRGFVFRNLVRNHGFFTSLYSSSLLFALYQISIKDLIGVSLDQAVIYAFTNVFPTFAAGLFLGFFFYKTGRSLLGPLIFSATVRFFLDPYPILSSPSPPWWMALTLEAVSFVVLIFIVDSVVKEPQYLRRRYGLGD
jgi:membrane protease YdiL (CAAX protease family)